MVVRKGLLFLALLLPLLVRPAAADDIAEVLRLVNEVRADVGASPLTRSQSSPA